MREHWSRLEEGEGWHPLFTRPFNNWELEDVERLLAQLGQKILVDEEEDK